MVCTAIATFGVGCATTHSADTTPLTISPTPWQTMIADAAAADVVINKSGTANLEVALMNVPQVVTYRLSNLTGFIAKYIVRFTGDYVSPVNLMENQPIVPELLQWDAKPEAISEAALTLLTDEDKRQKMIAGYAQMRQAMGEVGVCDRAANELLDMLPN